MFPKMLHKKNNNKTDSHKLTNQHKQRTLPITLKSCVPLLCPIPFSPSQR